MLVKLLYDTKHFSLPKGNTEFKIGSNETLFPLGSTSPFKLYFTDRSFWDALGEMNSMQFQKNPFVLSIGEFQQEKDWIEFSEKNMEYIQLLFFCLWFVKDNSCNVFNQFTYPEKGEIFTRRRSVMISSCQGTFFDTEYNVKDFEEAAQWLEKINSISTPDNSTTQSSIHQVGVINKGSFASRSYNSNNRLERAWTFLQIARGVSFLSTKISMYVLIIECLFSGDETAEITHKIAERIANYVGGTKKEKAQTFSDIKVFYAIRSKYVHGQKLSNPQDKQDFQKDVAMKIDLLVRNVFKRILDNDISLFLDSGQKLNEYFNSLLFQ